MDEVGRGNLAAAEEAEVLAKLPAFDPNEKRRTMMKTLPINTHLPFPYEDTRTWNALRDALRQLESREALRLGCGERPILAVLCAALDRAGVFSLGD